MDKQTLFEQVRTLNNARMDATNWRNKEENLLDALKTDPLFAQYQNVIDLRKTAEATAKAMEVDIRNNAVLLAQETGERKFPGVSVTEGEEVIYEPKAAVGFCISHGYSNFLDLNAKRFDDWMKTSLPAGVITEEEIALMKAELKPKLGGRIASDLDKAIAEYLIKEVGSVVDDR